MNYLVTYLILGAVVVAIARWWHKHDSDEQFRRDYQDGLAAGARDTLGALIEATREKPHESLAWGPGAGQPVPYALTDFDLWETEYETRDAS